MMPKIAYQFDRELSLVAWKVLRLFSAVLLIQSTPTYFCSTSRLLSLGLLNFRVL